MQRQCMGDMKVWDDLTPLHAAARYGCKEVCELLIRCGSNVNIQATDGNTPLHCAACNNMFNVCVLLLSKGANISMTNNHTETPLVLARMFSDPRTVSLLRPQIDGSTHNSCAMV